MNRLPLQTGPRHDHRPGHLQLLQGIRRGLEVPPRKVQIHRGVRQIGVAQQELNRAQISPCFQQMRRVRVPQRILTLLMNRPPPSFTIGIIRFTANT